MANITATSENHRSEWSRYQIRIIMENDCQTLGAVVAASDDNSEAKKIAAELGSKYYYGVAIVDIEDGVVDAGECDGEKLIFDLDQCEVR
jgi:hypothetical protein